MKKIVGFGVAFSLLFTTGVALANDDAETNEDELSVRDYYPLTENYEAFFQGDGIEFSTFTRVYDFIHDDFVQMRTNNTGTTTIEVVEVNDDGVYVWYQAPEGYVREDFISRIQDYNEAPIDTLLEAPLEVGNTWEYEFGTREIISIDEIVETEYGTFENVIVVSDIQDMSHMVNDSSDASEDEYIAPEFETESYKYYAPGVGLILDEFKTVYEDDDEEDYVVTSQLSTLETDGWYETITVFVPDEQGIAIHPEEYELFIETNDYMREEFRSIFAGEHDGIPQIAPDDLKINYMYTNWNFDLSDRRLFIDFSEEITQLGGSTGILMTLEPMLQTISHYYMDPELIVTVEGEPLYVEGHIQFEEGEVYQLDDTLVEWE